MVMVIALNIGIIAQRTVQQRRNRLVCTAADAAVERNPRICQRRLGTAASFMGYTRVSNPKPGDICCNDHHCGIYIGDGQMIHAPRTGDVVKISAVHSGMIYTRY